MNEPVIDWYFDFISPFAYLQWHRLRREAPQLALNPKPVLFAGLLSHWDNKGPVEIAPKRSWTYAHCLWLAQRHEIPMQLPAAHPFNPLPLLRLSLALGATKDVVDRLFWGVDATDMLLGYVAGDAFFRSEAYALAHNLPAAVHRKK
jgi:2-hydroxychromene-2-carboxylate isomerase